MPGPHPISPRNSPPIPASFSPLPSFSPMPNSSAPGFRFNSRVTLIPCALSAAANPRWPCCVRWAKAPAATCSCGFCLCEWEFRRIVCPGCDEKDHAKLPVYTAAEFPYIRVECCDTCHTYIKSIDLSKNGLADPLVDELASVPLDLWAQDRGYAKLHPNLLAM